MKKIVVDMQNFLFADSIATAFKNSDYDIAVVRAESPRDTIELCRVFKPFVLLMEVTAYTPWLLCERMKLRDEAKTVCPDCKIALIVDTGNTQWIEGRPCLLFALGTDSEDQFVRERYYGVCDNLVYSYDAISDTWSTVGRQ